MAIEVIPPKLDISIEQEFIIQWLNVSVKVGIYLARLESQLCLPSLLSKGGFIC